MTVNILYANLSFLPIFSFGDVWIFYVFLQRRYIYINWILEIYQLLRQNVVFLFTFDICDVVNNWSNFSVAIYCTWQSIWVGLKSAVSIMLDLKEDYNQDKSQSELPFGGPLWEEFIIDPNKEYCREFYSISSP